MAHWAINLRAAGSDLIYQANGDEGKLDLDIRKANPKNSSRFRKEIKVSDIDDEVEVKRILEGQPMNNDVASWNCQDWVMEALEALNDEMLLGDYQYNEAKDTLMELYHGWFYRMYPNF